LSLKINILLLYYRRRFNNNCWIKWNDICYNLYNNRKLYESMWVDWCLAVGRWLADACSLWKSYVTLFWSLFGLTQLGSVREGQIQNFTKRVAEYMLLCYHAMAVIVLVNMLIAMMSNSFQEIEVTNPACLPAQVTACFFPSTVSQPATPASVKYCPLITASFNPNYTARWCIWFAWRSRQRFRTGTV